MSTPSNPTYTYSGDPSSSSKDAVRFLAQATGEDKATGFVSDEEIAWLLTQEPNVYLAAALVADRVSSYFGSQRSKTVGPLTISGADQSRNYALLANTLRGQASLGSTGGGGPEFTGDTTIVFNIGMHDIPEGGFLAGSPNLLGELP
jgi:hypothetical protein